MVEILYVKGFNLYLAMAHNHRDICTISMHANMMEWSSNVWSIYPLQLWLRVYHSFQLGTFKDPSTQLIVIRRSCPTKNTQVRQALRIYFPSDHALRAKHPAHQLCTRPLGCCKETEDSEAKSQLQGKGCHSSMNIAWLMAAAITSSQQWQALTTMLWGTITSVGHSVLLFPY